MTKKVVIIALALLLLIPSLAFADDSIFLGTWKTNKGANVNGYAISVTADNNVDYIQKMLDYDITVSSVQMSSTFGSGFLYLLDKYGQIIKYNGVEAVHQINSSSGKTTFNPLVTGVRGFRIQRGSYTMTVKPGADIVYNLPPLTSPTSLQVEEIDKKLRFTWSDSNSPEIRKGFYLYQNGNRVSSLITATTYEFTPLFNQNFSYYVTAVGIDDKETNRSNTVTYLLKEPLKSPNLAYRNLTFYSVDLFWDRTAEKFEVWVNDDLYAITDKILFSINDLVDDTDYEIKVVAFDNNGQRVESNVVSFRTLPVVLDKPIVTVKQKTHESIDISWSNVNNALNYEVYLNDILIDSVTDTKYSFTNLKHETLYKITVKAKKGINESSVDLNVFTEKAPVPTIVSAKLIPDPNNFNKRTLSYSHANGVEFVKVYLGGVLIGEYPVDVAIELDVSDIEDKLLDISLEPVPVGKSLNIKALKDSTGTELDQPISEMVSGFDVLRNAFLYLVIASILLVILVVAFFWLRYKFKQNVGGEKFNGASYSGFGVDFKEKKKHAKTYHNKNNGFGLENSYKESDRVERLLSKKYNPSKRNSNRFNLYEKKENIQSVGLFGMGGVRKKLDITYEKDGVLFKRKFVKGKGYVFVPKDVNNRVKLVKANFKTIKNGASRLFPKQK